jgi:hypothetical protein
MGKFLLGFVLGIGIGAGIASLLTPEPGHVARERLRVQTDRYAGGDDSPLGTVRSMVDRQRNRLEEAVEAGRQASAETQAQLWAELKLSPQTPKSAGGATVYDNREA